MSVMTSAMLRSVASAPDAAFQQVRARSVALAAPLSAEDCCVQSMPNASPIKWHLAHTTWFFETFILERFESGFKPYDAAFRVIFNSYYHAVGERHPRPQRGLLTRPALEQVLAYRRAVDLRILTLLETCVEPELLTLLELGLQHEQQHQELMLTDLKHLLSHNPLGPIAYVEPLLPAVSCQGVPEWISFKAGVVEIGHVGSGFCFDNETPRHRQFVEAFELAPELVTNADMLDFIAAGGYEESTLWLSEGWDWLQAQQISHPLYWSQAERGWQQFTLQGCKSLDLQQPALHLSYFEADAYARWAGARLPTEMEWESASGDARLKQLFGVGWQWTSSSYAPYPGYVPAAGALGEYNGKFMVNQYVLRGSSCATSAGHARPTYRNFFAADARWQFTGVRLARSLPIFPIN